MTPACMTSEELTLWLLADRAVHIRNRAFDACRDCPVSFAEEMRAQDCCNGEPGTRGRRRLPVEPWPRRSHPVPVYATEAERIEARRRTWRESKARNR